MPASFFQKNVSPLPKKQKNKQLNKKQKKKELKENGQFVQITNAGLRESHPHDISITKGGLFKAVLGMKTALKVTLLPQGTEVSFEAGVGIWKQQAVPTIISMLIFPSLNYNTYKKRFYYYNISKKK